MLIKQRLLVLALAVLTLGALALGGSDAEAARGGKNRVADTVALSQTDPHLGDAVTFAYSTSATGAEVRIQVACYQSGIGVAWAADQSAGTSFILGGSSSHWASNGGAADCVAYLYQRNIVDGTLARTSFSAGGAR